LQEPESQTSLGAAVIDDIIGLIILTVVTGLTQASESRESLSSDSLQGQHVGHQHRLSTNRLRPSGVSLALLRII